MPARHSVPSLVAACLLVGCAAPRTSKGLIDADGDGLAETVTVLTSPQDQQTVRLHLQKIEVGQKLQELAEQSDDSLKLLHSANRASAPEILASESRVSRANIAVIDARLALERTELLSTSESTMLDTDGDGLPDMSHRPARADQLLDQKLALRLKIFDQSRLCYARIEALQKSGKGSADELRVAARLMYEAELDWLGARMERDPISQDSDNR